jgi:ADP-ribose pyrophosphatase YjhB (NUDIX family)
VSTQDVTDTAPGWLEASDLDDVRDRVPLVYVEAVPVRLDHLGRVTHIGVLLRVGPQDSISQAIVSGRVLRGETVREALWRHLTKDLGPDSDPLLPASPAPFTIAEYFPDPARTGFYDPRHHAVALCYIVPIDGDCVPEQDTLDFRWVSVDDALEPSFATQMAGGHDRLVRLAAAHVQRLP